MGVSEINNLQITSMQAQQNSAQFRDAMALLGAAVCVISTNGPAGLAGMTATAVCSVSDDPPTMLVCIKRSATAFAAISGNAQVCINVLSDRQQQQAALFASKTPMAERFDPLMWKLLPDLAPELTGALCNLQGKITNQHSVATHDVLFVQISAITITPNQAGLMYFDRAYRQVSRS
jgi:flavin reductase